jgi:carbon monoxide dehydrogenase subunit G
MTKVVSKVCLINKPNEKVYNFISDFNNLKQLIPPDKVSNIQATQDTCSFDAENIGRVGMKIIYKEEFKLIKISGEGKVPFDFVLWVQFVNLAEENTKMRLTLQTELNPMMKAMIGKQLQKGINTIADQLTVFFNTRI